MPRIGLSGPTVQSLPKHIATDSEFSLTPYWLDSVPEGFQGTGQALAALAPSYQATPTHL